MRDELPGLDVATSRVNVKTAVGLLDALSTRRSIVQFKMVNTLLQVILISGYGVRREGRRIPINEVK